MGFAAETENIIDNAIKKVNKKNLDFIVANNVLSDNAGFKSDNNIVTIIDKNGAKADYPMMRKEDVAKVIIDKVIEMLNV